jgi:simple sugar transport system permease protein
LSYVFIASFLAAAVRMAIPILLPALGEVVAEKSGVLNIGIEGQMLLGAFAGFMLSYFTGGHLLAILVGGAAGALGSLIIAALCVSLLCDQIVTGIIFNIFTLGFTSFFYRAVFGVTLSPPTVKVLPVVGIPGLKEIPLLGEVLFRQNLLTYAAFALAVALWYFLSRTRFGLQLRACGENPRAAQAAGVDVFRIRYLCLLLGGFTAGIGGAFLSLGILGRFVDNMVAGRGFIALAIVILGRWNPVWAVGGSLLFGAADSLQLRLQAVGFRVPYQFMLMLPYVLTIVSLTTVGRSLFAPRALGQPYAKEGR